MSDIVLRHARIFDGYAADLITGRQVRVRDGVIQGLEPDGLNLDGADVVDCQSKVLMPGMIDAHVHVYMAGPGESLGARAPLSYRALQAANFLKHILSCGFTTVRDVGGADIGLAAALRNQLIEGPRLLYGGHAISQTGGHGDPRHPHEPAGFACCGCHLAAGGILSVIADGVDEVRKAVREELRRGATHIKITASGGVISPSDPIDRNQFSDAEIAVVVEEAERWGAYVAAHCHPAEGIKRLARLGVRSIEHGTMIDAEGAALVVENGVFVVPTLATGFALFEAASDPDPRKRFPLPKASLDKMTRLLDYTSKGLEVMRGAGVKMGFGTDLLGPLYKKQGSEFTLRAKVLTPLEILRSACAVNAELLRLDGEIGCVKAGAEADLLVVDGDPFTDLELLAKPEGAGLAVIMKSGRFIKRAP
jgi:imidazolonepropionase-like amidohydrolase